MMMTNNMKTILNSDFIISFGTFMEEKWLNDSIKEAIKNNSAKFIYMHPIDNADLKPFYTQLIKYEVGSEEGICGLLLNSFGLDYNEDIKNYIDDLDLGYISAESSAGEEEIEEALENSNNAKFKTLIVGNDIVNHERIDNIVKFLAIFKKYSDLNIVILDEVLEQKVSTCTNLDLEEIEELKSYNGTLTYSVIDDEKFDLIASQTFANVAKVSNNDEVYVISKDEKIIRTLKIDEKLHGTIAILNVKTDENTFNGYKYKQVKIQKVELQ